MRGEDKWKGAKRAPILIFVLDSEYVESDVAKVGVFHDGQLLQADQGSLDGAPAHDYHPDHDDKDPGNNRTDSRNPCPHFVFSLNLLFWGKQNYTTR